MTLRLIFTIMFLIVILFCDCKKEPLDYREKYVGKYNFEVERYEWVTGQGIINETQENTQGEVFYAKGELQKNIISIHYRESSTAQFKIDNLGFLFMFCNSKVGEFKENGKLEVSWSSNLCPGGGLGGGTGVNLRGNKF